MDDDPEIKAMQVAAGAISALEDDAAKARVIEWVARRFGVSVRTTTSAMAGVAGGSGSAFNASVAVEGFTDFADLLGAANPRTDVERALVGGFWFQAIKENPSFNAQDVNTQLKNAGQGLRNITDAFAGLISRRPQYVLQVAKTGRTKQARKTYKLTTAGIAAVRTMIHRSTNGEE